MASISEENESPPPSASAKTWAEVERVEPELASLNASLSRSRTFSNVGFSTLSNFIQTPRTPRSSFSVTKSPQDKIQGTVWVDDPLALGIVNTNTGELASEVQSLENSSSQRPFKNPGLSTGNENFAPLQLNPKSTEFSPETYIRVVHKNTSLDNLSKGIESVQTLIEFNNEEISKQIKHSLDRIFTWRDIVRERYRILEGIDLKYSEKLRSLSKHAEELMAYIYGSAFERSLEYERQKHAMDIIIEHRDVFQLPSRLKKAVETHDRTQILHECQYIQSVLDSQVPNAVIEKVKLAVDSILNEYSEEIYHQITDTGTSREIVEMLVNFLLKTQPTKNHIERIIEMRVESAMNKMQKFYSDLLLLNNEQKERQKEHVEPVITAMDKKSEFGLSNYLERRIKLVQSMCGTFIDCLSELERFTLRIVSTNHPIRRLAFNSHRKETNFSELGSASNAVFSNDVAQITQRVSRRISEIFSSCLSSLLNFCSDNKCVLTVEELIEIRSCERNILELTESSFDLRSAIRSMNEMITQYFSDMYEDISKHVERVEGILNGSLSDFLYPVSTDESFFSFIMRDFIEKISKSIGASLKPPEYCIEQVSKLLIESLKKFSKALVDLEFGNAKGDENHLSILLYWNNCLLQELFQAKPQSDGKSSRLFEDDPQCVNDFVSYIENNSKTLLDSVVKKLIYPVENSQRILEESSFLVDQHVEETLLKSWVELRTNLTFLQIAPVAYRRNIIHGVCQYMEELLRKYSLKLRSLSDDATNNCKVFNAALEEIKMAEVLLKASGASESFQFESLKEAVSELLENERVKEIEKPDPRWLLLEEQLQIPLFFEDMYNS